MQLRPSHQRKQRLRFVFGVIACFDAGVDLLIVSGFISRAMSFMRLAELTEAKFSTLDTDRMNAAGTRRHLLLDCEQLIPGQALANDRVSESYSSYLSVTMVSRLPVLRIHPVGLLTQTVWLVVDRLIGA